MGCSASNLDNQDTVRRCKDRCRLMKEAVYARHHLAAAHSDYCRALRITGSALVAFASGEPLAVSDNAPAVLLRTHSFSSAVRKPPAFVPPPSLHHPPPPPPMSDVSSNRSQHHQPPPSVHFQQLQNKKPPQTQINFDSEDEPLYTDNDIDDKASSSTAYSNSRDHTNQSHNTLSSDHGKDPIDDRASNYSDNSYAKGPPIRKGPNLKKWESEEDETEREEVQCSEWGDRDHYSSTRSSSNEEDESEDLKSIKNEANVASAKPVNIHANSKLSSEDDGKSWVIWGDRNSQRANSDRRIVVRHKDLEEIVAAIREYFDKAALAGEQVSEMLETGRAQLDRALKQLKETVYHSSGMRSSLSSSWTSKPPRFELSSIEQSGGPKSLCSTLERILAWEKKLYEEMKAREGVKIEHEKNLSSLQSQEYKGENEANKLDKTKTTLQRLQSLIVVASQAVSTTSSEIIGLRDSDLVPQLVETCHGFMYMWRSMNQFHETQNYIVQQVRGLVNQINKGQSTSDLHRQATRDLESAVSAWHSAFCRLARFQRDFVRSLHAWFKLTLVPIHHEPQPTNNTNKEQLSNAFSFCDEWKLALDRVPDTVASESIKSFINVVHSISLKQTEELKVKKRMETASKELERKASSLRSIEKKYYLLIGLPDSSGLGLDARDPLAELGSCQRKVEEEMQRHSRAVEVTRATTLNNIQTGLPGVFQAMTSFSALMNEALETVCNRSYTI